ncbi:hypothetical protein BOTBODRAFT_119959 [Botryobasidium botryosum FD-172 SS1]|uniref:2-amino-4-hydroxy-6-hydroxymethyldihydropteridine diphosphokinase n=1 Tax=Botryobasidium botryosum (strain FD-172 SS1) TaxID=930990 RepID=A0A067LYQ8_BOTB1|nr:hypothetical protein BOTBODRAFT_119959 [Botryobasidium botryosum FD-172 SS1]
MGSNLGDSVGHIEQALRELEKELGLRVLDTSFMYQSKPMYVEDQPDFVNCACLIETTLSPIALIALLKRIEVSVGRTPTIRNGPRVVDLDILFYDDIIMDNTAEVKEGELHLIIPHMRVNEREFVLRPLADMIPDHIHPILKQPIRILLAALMSTTSPSLTKIVPFPAPLSSPSSSPSPSPSPPFPPTNLPLHSRTYLMSTLNATPDSFSDGGVLDSADLPVASLALSNLIDVGGYSTRPNAAYVSPAEELRRVLPVLRAIREDHKLGMPVSIDTFRPAVAREALRHGATCVNDVRALEGEGAGEGGRAAMADVLREFAVPVVMMHSRGDAGANKDYSAFGGDVVEGVRAELGEKMRWALGPGKGGLRRWNVIVDPGIGFSKTVEDNTRLIRELRRLTAPPTGGATTLTFTDLRALLDVENDALRTHPLTGMPVLLGTSRKSFLGKLMLREEPEKADERGYATAVAITAGIAQGADIMRVHDVMEMRDAVRVADAMYRPRASS